MKRIYAAGVTALLALTACGSDADEGFDADAWRTETIAEFGPEEGVDYVAVAESVCDSFDAQGEEFFTSDTVVIGGVSQPRPAGYEFEGSIQQHMIETYCPNR